jgi:hypothetical protein
MIPLYIDLLNRSTVNGQSTALMAKSVNVLNNTYLRVITYILEDLKLAKTSGMYIFR